jgi:anti-sigma-K factor RskA
MTMHLRSQEFVDALDGSLEADRLKHLDGCAACREELAALRAVLTDVEPAGAVPDPSPLFWTHFSERVRQATAAAPAARRAAWWRSAWRPLAGIAAAAAVVALVLLARTWRDDAPPSQVVAGSTPVDAFAEDAESSIAFLSAAASDLSWEEIRAADLAPRAQVVDGAIERLSAAQRAEFVKLIREDLRSME